MSNEGEYVEQDNLYNRRPHPDAQGEPLWHDESGIIVFGGGQRVLGNRVLDLASDERGAELGLDRASEPDALAILRLTSGNPLGRRLASEEHVKMGLFEFESIL